MVFESRIWVLIAPFPGYCLLVTFIDTNLIQGGQLIDNITGRKDKTVEQFRVSSISTRHLTLSVVMGFVGSSLSRPFVHVTCAVDQSLAVTLVYFSQCVTVQFLLQSILCCVFFVCLFFAVVLNFKFYLGGLITRLVDERDLYSSEMI